MTSTLVVAQGNAVAHPAYHSKPAVQAAALHALTGQRGPGGRVIVLLKNKTTRFSAHTTSQRAQANAARQAQSDLVSAVKHAGGQVTHSFSLVNGFSATVSQAEANRLANDGDVAQVVPDGTRKLPTPASATARPAGPVKPNDGTAPPAGTCAPNGGVQLEPEALQATRANSDVEGAKTARSLGYTGKGVTVGWIADGLDPNNPDFKRDGKSIFTDYQDFSGTGPGAPTSGGEAYLDASAIAAQGNQTYDISHFSNLPLSTACKIRIEGEAPGVDMVGLNVFGANEYVFDSNIVAAIDYAVSTDHVNVLNESIGANPYPDDNGAQDAVKQANDAAVAAGTTITVSSGDAGVTNTEGSSATDPHVIGTGGTTTYRFDLQTGYAASRLPGITGWLSNNISSLSSSGFDQDGRTVDLVAPGELNWAVCTADADKFFGCVNYAGQPSDVEASGGTSEAAPTVAGVAALVVEAYRAGHSGANPTPAVVKDILTSTADDINAPAEQQGAGLVDAYKAVQLAKSYKSSTRTGNTIQSSATSFAATGKLNQAEKFTDTVTNTGTTTQTVKASSRALAGYTRIKTTSVTLSDADSPKYTDFQGIQDNLEKISFTVPSGEDRLNASIAFPTTSSELAARVRMTLVDPSGHLAGYSLPQGIGNYGNSQVAKPTAGNWTAYITSRTSAGGGTQGKVTFGASVAKFASLGSVSPSTLTLAPGASGTVTLTTDTKNTPGDRSGSLQLTTGTTESGIPATTTVPVTMRSVIPSGKYSFGATLTGGNGRQANVGEEFYYNLDVPSGAPALNAYVKLADDPNNTMYTMLVNPTGDAQAFGGNTTLASSGVTPVGVPQLGSDLHVLRPAAGRWTLIIIYAPTVSGNNLTEPFTVTTDQTAATVSSSGVPQSTKTVIKSGSTVTAYVKVKNSGNSPEAFFIDARLPYGAKYALAPQTNPVATVPLDPTGTLPSYLVPSRSVEVSSAIQTDGSTPLYDETTYYNGDPDLVSTTAGKTASIDYSSARVASGVWSIIPGPKGPFSKAMDSEDADTAMAVRTQEFDTSVKPSTGNLWLGAVDPSATYNTITVDPGQTATIPVRITASGKPRTVSGSLYIDDAQLIDFGSLSPNGNELAAIPYSYTVK